MSSSLPPPPRFQAPLIPVNLPVRRCPVPRASAEKRILIMRAGALGDILMGTPLLGALRAAYPTAHITWVAEHTQADAIDANPYVDEILVWSSLYWKRMLRRLQYPLWLARALAFRCELQARQYDLFLSLQPEEWPLLTYALPTARRIGVFDTWARYYRAQRTSPYTGRYHDFFTRDDLPPHRTDQYLLVLKALGLSSDVPRHMTLGFTAEDAAVAERLLAAEGIRPEADPFVILTPRTTWSTKNWPAERFAELGDRLTAEGVRVVLTGSPRERDTVEAVAGAMRQRPACIAGNVTFRQLSALIARARLLVSGDTGPMHAAAALDVPHVALFGATAPEWYGPLAGEGIHLSHPVPCGPCDQKRCVLVGEEHERCMRLITVDEVFAAARRLLTSKGRTPLTVVSA